MSSMRGSTRKEFYRHRPKDLRSHQWHYRGGGGCLIFCQICGWRFEDYDVFCRHTERYHNWVYPTEELPQVAPEDYVPAIVDPTTDFQRECQATKERILELKAERNESRGV